MTSRELAIAVCDTLRRNGHEAFLGFRVPSACPARRLRRFDRRHARAGHRTFPREHRRWCKIRCYSLVTRNGGKVEVATFRRDLDYSDGRHPDQVVYAHTPQEDVARRDFTINGLAMRHDTGEVLDFVGGQADLKAGLIRAIGDPGRRFTEDKLRMLRAVRFASRFAYTIEPRTFSAVQEHAREIHAVSAERIHEELSKLLTEGAARRGFELLDESCLLPGGLAGNFRPEGMPVPQPPEFHPEGDVWTHTRMMLAGLPVLRPCSMPCRKSSNPAQTPFYVVLGATHPNLVRQQGEAYRDSLTARVRDLGIEDHVVFFNQFVDQATLLDFISMCDVYATPYLNEAQMTSGTLAYSFGLGKAVVSTPYWHAKELLSDGCGILVPFRRRQSVERRNRGPADERRASARDAQTCLCGKPIDDLGADSEALS